MAGTENNSSNKLMLARGKSFKMRHPKLTYVERA